MENGELGIGFSRSLTGGDSNKQKQQSFDSESGL
jgi:hypothetical protein